MDFGWQLEVGVVGLLFGKGYVTVLQLQQGWSVALRVVLVGKLDNGQIYG
jgi:hypothetical protein